MELAWSGPVLLTSCLYIFLSVQFQSACSQRLSIGPCKNIAGIPHFNISQYTDTSSVFTAAFNWSLSERSWQITFQHFPGEWYEVERSFYLIESALRCTKINFSPSPDLHQLNVNITYKLPWRNEQSSAIYGADLNGENQSVLELVLKDAPGYLSRLAPGSGIYTILDTDYTDYALIYSCTNLRFFHADFVWVLGRDRDISANMRSHVYSSLDSLSIPRERLLLTKQDC